MPSSSEKQHRFMEAVKHDPKFAKKAGVPQSVGRDFVAADKHAGKYAKGGEIKGRNYSAEAMEKTTHLSAHPGTAAVEKPLKSIGKKTGVDLSKHELIEENEHHFHVKGPHGSFKVAKAGLSQPTVMKIKQHFAKGGAVKGYAKGGAADAPAETTPPEEVPPPPGLPPKPRPEMFKDPKVYEKALARWENDPAIIDYYASLETKDSLTPAEQASQRAYNSVGDLPTANPAQVDTTQRFPSTYQAATANPVDRGVEAQQSVGGNPQYLYGNPQTPYMRFRAPNPEYTPDAPTPGNEPGTIGPTYDTAILGAAGPGGQLAPPPGPNMAGAPDAAAAAPYTSSKLQPLDVSQSQLDQSYAQGAPQAPAAAGEAAPGESPMSRYDKHVEDVQKSLEVRKGLEIAAAQEEQNALNQVLKAQQKWEKDFAYEKQKNDEEILRLRMAMENFQIKPKDVFANATTGQKILTAIGLIMGSIGGMGNGGKNMAVEVINKAIDRDLDAQKANLGKLQSLYSMQIQKGRTDIEASGMALAGMKETASIMLKQAAAKFAGTLKGAELDTLSAQYAAQSDAIRQDIALKATQAAMGQYQLMTAKLQVGLLQRLAQSQGATGAQPAPGGNALQFTGSKQVALNEDDTPASMPVTRYFVASGPKAQEAAMKYQAEEAPIREKVLELQALVHKYQHGAIPYTALRGQIEALRNFLGLAWMKTGEGVNRLNRQEQTTIEKSIIPALEELRPLGKEERGIIDQVARIVNDRHAHLFRTWFGTGNMEVGENDSKIYNALGMGEKYPIVNWTENVPYTPRGVQ